jgi:pimeloyl-ACP methyl ester carboxylesterase
MLLTQVKQIRYSCCRGIPNPGKSGGSFAPELAKNHRVIIPDLRGMGLSEAAADGYDLSNPG